jgi:hypothetical protein
MYPACDLILARMYSNPEEFTLGQSRWASILNMISEHAPKDEWKQILERRNEIRMDELHKMVMKELCAPKEVKEAKLIAPAAMKQQMLDLWNKNNGA